MKKRLSIVIAIAVLSMVLVSSFAGCSTTVDNAEGITYLKTSIANTAKAEQYYLRNVYIIDAHQSSDVQITVFKNNPKKGNEHAAKITLVESDLSTTKYYSKFWGNSLKSGVSYKKATDADWKKSYMAYPNPTEDKDAKTKTPYLFKPMTIEEFMTVESKKFHENDSAKAPTRIVNCTMADLILRLDTFMLSSEAQNPTKISRQGRVTTYYYENIGLANAILFGSRNVGYTAKDGEKFPLIIETTNDHISKVTDKVGEDKGHIRYYVTMQGPNISMPAWTDAAIVK